MTSLDGAVLGLLGPLDRARALVLRRFAGSARALVRQRGQRIALFAVLSVASAAFCTLAAPLTLITLGPLLLGVPHLLSDVRYLIVRQGLHRRAELAPAALCLALAVVQPSWHWGACALATTALAARCAWRMRVVAALLCIAAASAAWTLGARADVLFAHGHNLMALVFWATWARSRRAMRPALLLFLAASAAILSGVADDWLLRSSALTPGAFTLPADQLVSSLTLTRDPTHALRWVAFFAFAQAVHYGIWLRVLPEEDRVRSTPRTYRASYRALSLDLRQPLLFVALLLACGLPMWGLADAQSARDNYLRLALFHGPLELAVMLVLVLEGQRVRREA